MDRETPRIRSLTSMRGVKGRIVRKRLDVVRTAEIDAKIKCDSLCSAAALNANDNGMLPIRSRV